MKNGDEELRRGWDAEPSFFILLLRPHLKLLFFCSIERSTLLAVFHAFAIETATDDMVTNSGKILNTASADSDDRVLLEIVSFTANICGDFHAIRELHSGDLSKR